MSGYFSYHSAPRFFPVDGAQSEIVPDPT